MTETSTTTAYKLGKHEPVQPSQMRLENGPIVVCMAPSGAGKTTMLETLNDSPYEPVCVLDVDGKAHVLTDRPGKRDVYPCHDWKQLDDHVQALVKERLHPHHLTVCFDGTTAIQQVLSYAKYGLKDIDNPQLRQTAYGRSNVDMVDLAQSARLLAEAGIHVIFNIWATPEKDESPGQSGVVRITPDISPTLLNRFLGLFDYVVYLEQGNQPNPYPPVMYWGGSVSKATRAATSPESPLNKMPERIYRPSWATLFDSYHGKPFPIEKHSK